MAKFRTKHKFRGRHKKVVKRAKKNDEANIEDMPITSASHSSTAKKFDWQDVDLEEMQPEDIPEPKSTDCFALFQKEAINQLLSSVACSLCFVPGQVGLRSGRGKVHGPISQGQTCLQFL